MLAAGFGLQKANSLGTPAIKESDVDVEQTKTYEKDCSQYLDDGPAAKDGNSHKQHHSLSVLGGAHGAALGRVRALNAHACNCGKSVTVDENNNSAHGAIAYSGNDPLHPSQIVILSSRFARAKPHVDRFTHKSSSVMNARQLATVDADKLALANLRRKLISTQLEHMVLI